jgi:hypothetical protein
MTTAYPRRTSYGIFVRFRRSRLALRRGVAQLEEALEIAQQLRASRFHDRGEIFVVKEPEGTIVELAPPSDAPTALVTAQPQSVSERPPPAAPDCAEGEPLVLPPAPAHDEAPAYRAIHRDRARVLHLIEQIDLVRRTIARSHAALARFERAFDAAESLLQDHGGSSPDVFRRNHQRLAVLRASAAKSVASFEQTAVLLERRLESAWTDAMAPRVPAL